MLLKANLMAVLAVLLLCRSTAIAQSGASVPVAPKPMQSMNLSWIDKTVDPCNDFYRYACGGWIRENPVPADQERVAVFLQMNDSAFYLLYEQLNQAVKTPKTPLQRQYGTFYAACMNAEQANGLGTKPLQETLAAITAISRKAQIASFLGDQQLLGSGFFKVTVTQDDRDATKQNLPLQQDGLTLPTPDYYVASDSRHTATLSSFRQYLETVFQQLGDEPKQAVTETQGVLEVETALAK